MRQASFKNRFAYGSADSLSSLVTFGDGTIQKGAGLLSHAETPIAEAGRDIFGGFAHEGELEVMDDSGAVHDDSSYDAPLHEIDDQRAESDLDRMRAHAQENGFISAVRQSDFSSNLC